MPCFVLQSLSVSIGEIAGRNIIIHHCAFLRYIINPIELSVTVHLDSVSIKILIQYDM